MVLASLLPESRAETDSATQLAARTNTRRGVASPRVKRNQRRQKFADRRHGGETIQLASWNVRSLVNVSGPAETAFTRKRNGSGRGRNLNLNLNSNLTKDKDDRRIDIVVGELTRLGIEVAGLQETHWFGTAEYAVRDSIVLSCGRPLPPENGNFRRGEGVAIVLRGRALSAWRSGGSQWTGISSRLASARVANP